MAIKSGVNVDGSYVPAANGSILTPSADVTRAKITSANFFANAGATIQVFVVPSGGSPDNTNKVLEKTMTALESFTPLELIGESIEAGGSLQANDGGTGTLVNFVATITEYSGDD